MLLIGLQNIYDPIIIGFNVYENKNNFTVFTTVKVASLALVQCLKSHLIQESELEALLVK